MAIKKKLIHFNSFTDFNSKKLSANENNNSYTEGIDDSIEISGNPDILWQSIVFIKDTKQIWTHGLIYSCKESEVYVGDSSNAPSNTKIIVDSNESSNVEVYSKSKVDTLLTSYSSKIPIVNMEDSTASISPNIFYIWGEMSELDITLNDPEDTEIYNEYMFQFTSGSSATTITLPATIKWMSDLIVNSNTTYQISIVNNIGIIIKAS